MRRKFTINDEPVHGYRLSEYLGGGAFGDVWRAKGPGGADVALKIIKTERDRWEKEFKSVAMVKDIHHPNLVPIVAIWMIDANGSLLDDRQFKVFEAQLLATSSARSNAAVGRKRAFDQAAPDFLVVAMGLGEKDLHQVLEEQQSTGEVGIPRDTLLRHVEDTAWALDFLNDQGIYHCDIKPSNIMLVGNRAQVCDLGLARSHNIRTSEPALTVAYAPPELWQNAPTRGTDQYSLAVTYYELCTGELPIPPDVSWHEAKLAHDQGYLKFDGVGSKERAVLQQATSKDPSKRFASCVAFVNALRSATVREPRPDDTEVELVAVRPSILQRGAQLVPGYRLGQHLFYADTRTDVWSATGPENRLFSLWIYEIGGASPGIDFEALRLVQHRTEGGHQHLARLFGWWCLNDNGADVTARAVRDGVDTAGAAKLVVASEYARNNLVLTTQDRGDLLPPDILLDYVRQAASALDAMNASGQHSEVASLLHTDVRPANLLMVNRLVKLANFAWCRVLRDEEAQFAELENRPQRLTSAPELGEGRLHRRSDQYSLAASYAQMRSGTVLQESALPSATTELSFSNDLGVTKLGPAEREVVERAMALDPRQRYSDCAAFIEALAATRPSETPVTGRRTPETMRGNGESTRRDLVVRPAGWRSVRIFTASLAGLITLWGAAFIVSNRSETIDQKSGQDPITTPSENNRITKKGPQEHLADTELFLRTGGLSKARESLTNAQQSLDDTESADSPLHEKYKLLDAWLSYAERKSEWVTSLRHRLDEIGPDGLSGTDQWRYRVLDAISKAFGNETNEAKALSPDADLVVLGRAIDKVRQRGGWKKGAVYQDEPLLDAMRSLMAAVARRLHEDASSSDPKTRELGRAALLYISCSDFEDFDDSVQIPFRVADACLLLSNSGTKKWTDLSPAWERALARGALAHDAQLLAARLIAWADRPKLAESDLREAIASYQRLEGLRPSSTYAELLCKWIEQLGSHDVPDWPLIQNQCNRVINEAEKLKADGEFERRYFADLFLKECALEDGLLDDALRLSPKDENELPKQFVGRVNRGYCVFVMLAVDEANSRRLNPRQVDQLCEAYQAKDPNELLATKPRRRRAARILAGAARELAVKHDFAWTFLGDEGTSHEKADRAFRWLSRAKSLDPDAAGAVEDFDLLLASASLEKTDPEVPPPIPIDERTPEDKQRIILGLNARASRGADAIRYYAHWLRLIDLMPGQNDLALVYSTVVKPALKIASETAPETLKTVPKDVAYLYATKGSLLRLDPVVDLAVFNETEGKLWGDRAVFDCYEKAIECDPSMAEYFIQRGIARFYSAVGDERLLVEELQSKDVEAARQLAGDMDPAFGGLLAITSVLEARLAAGIEELPKRVAFYEDALDKARGAARACKHFDRTVFLRLESAACLDLALSARKPKAVIRGYLEEAVASSVEAVKAQYDSHPEYSYQAKGNAEEDTGLLLGDLDSYRNALITFQQMRERAATTNEAAQADALTCLGRTSWWLASSLAEGNPEKANCASDALKYLQEAATARLAELVSLESSEQKAGAAMATVRQKLADIYYRQACVHSRGFTVGNNDALIAIQNCLQYSPRDSETWPEYQLRFATISSPSDMRDRAREVLKATDTKADGEARARALKLIFKTYLTGATGPRLLQEIKAVLDEYREYVPLDNLEDATPRDIYALLDLAELLAGEDTSVWARYRNDCEKVSKRALALASTLEIPYVLTRARHARALHEFKSGFQSSDRAMLARAAALERKVIELDDKLDDADLSAAERGELQQSYAFTPRFYFANANYLVAQGVEDVRQRKQLRTDSLAALRRRIPPDPDTRRRFADLERLWQQFR